MGNTFNGLFEQQKEIKLVLIGLEKSGKTSILHKIRVDDHYSKFPFVGIYPEPVRYKNRNFVVYDLDGNYKTQPLWRHWYSGAFAILFVIDSTDREKFSQAAETLQRAMSDFDAKDCKLLIWANKQDLPDSANVELITTAFKLESIKQEWHIQPCSAIKEQGLLEGLDWLSKKL